MFLDELCLQLVGDYRTAVHRREAQAQECDLLRLQGVGQHHRQQPLCGLLRQVQQVPEENTRPPPTETCPTSGGRSRSGAPRATSTSVYMSAAHAGVTITLKFSFGIEPSPE